MSALNIISVYSVSDITGFDEERLEEQQEILVSTELISGFTLYFEPDRCERDLFPFLFNQVIEQRFMNVIMDVDTSIVYPCIDVGGKKYIGRTKGLTYGSVQIIDPEEERLPMEIDFALKVKVGNGFMNVGGGVMPGGSDVWMGSAVSGVVDDDIIILDGKQFVGVARKTGVRRRIKTEILNRMNIGEKRIFMDILKRINPALPGV